MQMMKTQAERFDAEYRTKTVTEIDTTSRPFKIKLESGEEILAETAIISTGASAKVPWS